MRDRLRDAVVPPARPAVVVSREHAAGLEASPPRLQVGKDGVVGVIAVDVDPIERLIAPALRRVQRAFSAHDDAALRNLILKAREHALIDAVHARLSVSTRVHRVLVSRGRRVLPGVDQRQSLRLDPTQEPCRRVAFPAAHLGADAAGSSQLEQQPVPACYALSSPPGSFQFAPVAVGHGGGKIPSRDARVTACGEGRGRGQSFGKLVQLHAQTGVRRAPTIVRAPESQEGV